MKYTISLIVAVIFLGVTVVLAKFLLLPSWQHLQLDHKLYEQGTLVQGHVIRFDKLTYHTSGRGSREFVMDTPVIQFTATDGAQREYVATEYGLWANEHLLNDVRLGQVIPIYYLPAPSTVTGVKMWRSNTGDRTLLTVSALGILVLAVVTLVTIRQTLKQQA